MAFLTGSADRRRDAHAPSGVGGVPMFVSGAVARSLRVAEGKAWDEMHSRPPEPERHCRDCARWSRLVGDAGRCSAPPGYSAAGGDTCPRWEAM